ADIRAVYERYPVLDPSQIGSAGIGTIFDSRWQNIASTVASGIELSSKLSVPTERAGEFTLQTQGRYLAQLANQPAPGVPFVSGVNTVLNPPRLRLQARASWSYRGWTLSGDWDYTGGYRDTLTPGDPAVASWLITNAHLSYRAGDLFAGSPLENTMCALHIN